MVCGKVVLQELRELNFQFLVVVIMEIFVNPTLIVMEWQHKVGSQVGLMLVLKTGIIVQWTMLDVLQ